MASIPSDLFRGFSETQISEAFDSVCGDDWKAPIAAVIAESDRELVGAAVAFYTATDAVFSPAAPDRLFVQAVGYRNGPAGP